MSAIKLSLYIYRVFAVVFTNCKLYLVAQEVRLGPIHTLRDYQRTSQRKRHASVCMSRYNLVTQKSRQFRGVKSAS